jgi:hypothetical protein
MSISFILLTASMNVDDISPPTYAESHLSGALLYICAKSILSLSIPLLKAVFSYAAEDVSFLL